MTTPPPPEEPGHGRPQAWVPAVPQQPGPPRVDPFRAPAPVDQPTSYGAYGYGPPPVWAAPVPATDPLAVPALVLGIVGMTCVTLLAPVALVMGVVATRRIARTGAQGRGTAVAGLVLGAIGTVLLVLTGVLVVAAATGGW